MAFMTIGAPVKLVVRAAKHVMPKATKGHTKTRPIKVRASLMRKDRPPTTLNPEQRRRPAGTGLCAMRFSGELCERRIPTGPGPRRRRRACRPSSQKHPTFRPCPPRAVADETLSQSTSRVSHFLAKNEISDPNQTNPHPKPAAPAVRQNPQEGGVPGNQSRGGASFDDHGFGEVRGGEL